MISHHKKVYRLGLLQIINEPTHLFFFFLLIESSGSSWCSFLSSYNNYHHQITFEKFDQRIKCPPTYQSLFWNCKKAQTVLLRIAINDFNWEYAFSSIYIHQKVENVGQNSFKHIPLLPLF